MEKLLLLQSIQQMKKRDEHLKAEDMFDVAKISKNHF